MSSSSKYDVNPNTSSTTRKIYNIIDELEEKLNRRVTTRTSNNNNNYRYDSNISYVLPYNNLNVTSIPISDQIRFSNQTNRIQTILPSSQILIETPPKQIIQSVSGNNDEILDITKQIKNEFNSLNDQFQNYQNETNNKINNLVNIINNLNDKKEKSVLLDEASSRDIENINRNVLELKKQICIILKIAYLLIQLKK